MGKKKSDAVSGSNASAGRSRSKAVAVGICKHSETPRPITFLLVPQACDSGFRNRWSARQQTKNIRFCRHNRAEVYTRSSNRIGIR